MTREKNIRNEFPQLVPHHILRNRNLLIDLAVVHRKFQTDEVREDSCRARLGLDRWRARGRGHLLREGETVEKKIKNQSLLVNVAKRKKIQGFGP